MSRGAGTSAAEEEIKMISEKPSWIRHEGLQIFSIDIQAGGLRFATGGGDHKVRSFAASCLFFKLNLNWSRSIFSYRIFSLRTWKKILVLLHFMLLTLFRLLKFSCFWVCSLVEFSIISGELKKVLLKNIGIVS